MSGAELREVIQAFALQDLHDGLGEAVHLRRLPVARAFSRDLRATQSQVVWYSKQDDSVNPAVLHPKELENGGCLGPVLLGDRSERPETENGEFRKRGEIRVF